MDLSDLHSVRPLEQSIDHVDALPPGTRLGEFELRGLIGVGGFGMVYRAFDHILQRTVAIKEYLPGAMASRRDGQIVVRAPADHEAYAAGLAAFVNEARLLARFDHPSLVKVLRFWEADGTAYMVMPLYKGVTLKQARGMIDEPPTEAWLRKVMWSVLQVLKLLHEQYFIHRDISPDNVFLQDIGPPILLDLGSARMAISEHERRHTAVLKVNYAPIEQYAQSEGIAEGPWTDIYSLAAVIYGVVRNDPPLPATLRAVRERMPTMIHVARTVQVHFGRSYTREFAVAIDRALRVQPEDRPQSVAAFIALLNLKAPAGMEGFDWWREVEEAELASVPKRSWGLWNRRVLPLEGGAAGRNGGGAWKQTWQREAVVSRTFEPSRGDTRAPLSTLEFTSTLGVAAPPRPVRVLGRQVRRIGMVMGLLAVSVTALWMIRSTDRGPAAVLASAKPAASAATHQAKAGAEGQRKAAVAPVVRSPVEQADQRDDQRADVVAAKAAPKVTPRKKIESVPVPAVAAETSKRELVVQTELCAETNFLTRPMCLHRECQKPEYAQQQICVEAREREQQKNAQMGRI